MVFDVGGWRSKITLDDQHELGIVFISTSGKQQSAFYYLNASAP
jgi:hypothetical protein